MFNVKHFGMLLLVIITLTGCSLRPKILKELHTYQVVPLQQAEYMPDKSQLARAGKKTRVAVRSSFNDQLKNKKLAAEQETLLTQMAVKSAEGYISETGAEIINLSKQNRSADYMTELLINSITYKSDYDSSSKSCNYDTTSSGSLKIYKMPETRIIKSLELNGSSRFSQSMGEVEGEPNLKFGNLLKNALVDAITSCPPITHNFYLSQNAVADSLSKAKKELKDFFAPQGYVLEKKYKKEKNIFQIYEENTIFKISLGKAHHLENGDHVIFFTKHKDLNTLTNETRVEERQIARGKVTDVIGDNYAWVLVGDVNEGKKVRKGDIARVTYTKTFFWN
jgi:hypothetical protein